jgi:hypothetical protein
MNMTIGSSGVNLINSAQLRSESAAKELAGLTPQKTDGGEIEYNSGNLIKPVLDLKQAKLETSAAAKLIEADQQTIGSILDIKA